MSKIVLIGCGNVGMSYAYSLVNQYIEVDELVLVDVNEDKLVGEILDLNHAIPYAPNSDIIIRIGTYDDCADADIIVLTAGVNRKVGDTRLDLINKNKGIFNVIVTNVMSKGFNGIFIVATNPVDVMTKFVLEHSKLDSTKVIGTGTLLDTARLKSILSEKLNVKATDIDAYVLGEHGDSSFIVWSGSNISSLVGEKEIIEKLVRDSSQEIIKRKGMTEFGIGMALTKITDAIINDLNITLPVSTLDKDNNVCISTPSVINRNGAYKIDLLLNKTEQEKYNNSINILREASKEL